MKSQRDKRRMGFVAACGLVLATALAACSSSAGADAPAAADAGSTQASASCAKQYTIAFSHAVSEAIVVKAVRGFIDERAAEIGCITVLHDNTTKQNLEDQLSAIDTWINQGVDAIIALPVDAKAMAPYVERAHEKGIKFLTYAFPVEGGDGNAGFDATQSGQAIGNAAAAWAKENCPDGGCKALITSLTAVPGLAPRWEEPKKILEAAGVEVVAVQDAADVATGLSVTETTLQAHPDLNIVIGLNDDAAVGAYQAFKNAKKDPAKSFIGGQDGSLEGLKAVEEGGAYKATAALDLKQLGANIVDLSINAINGVEPTSKDAPSEVVTLADKPKLDALIASFEKLSAGS